MSYELLLGDCIEVMRTLPANSVQCVVTSPPYFGLRDYGTAAWEGGDATCQHAVSRADSDNKAVFDERVTRGKRSHCLKCGARRIDQQIGLEDTPEAYVAKLVEVFREVRRVLHPTGTCWINIGDSYNGSGGAGGDYGPGGLKEGQPKYPGRRIAELKPKDLIGIPWMVAFALRADGWWLRSEIIWCLSGGTWVYAKTQKGEMPMMIGDMARLDPSTVKLWNGTKWTQVLGWSRSVRNSDEIEMVLRSGERISCTPNHQWPTARGLLRADELRVGDCLLSCRLPEPVDVHAPEAIPTETAWFLGLYLAEGSRSGSAINIAGHMREVERIERLRAIAEYYGGSLTYRIHGNHLSIRMYGGLLHALVDQYISGEDAKTKGLKVRCWQHSNEWLRSLLAGYLDGDGHWDAPNSRWRLGFTRNYNLERDLRVLCARLGLSLTLKLSTATYQGGELPSFRGEIRMDVSDHHNVKSRTEIVEIRKARCREVYDIGVEDEPHLFALASGILTHNSKKAPMPESVTDRPTKAHEQVFLLSKQANYFYDAEAIREPWADNKNGAAYYARRGISRPDDERRKLMSSQPKEGGNTGLQDSVMDMSAGRNKRSVWTLGPESFSGTTQTSRLEPVERNALSDDTICKVSPDCPVHAGLFDWAAMDSYDVPIVDLLPRIARKRDRRAPKLTFGSVPTDQQRGAVKPGQNSDSLHPPYSLFATDHSNGNHKTAPDPVTSPPYIASGQTLDRIGDRSNGHDSDAPSQNKPLNSKVGDGSASNGLPQIPDRNAGTYELPDSFSPLYVPPECTCSFYHEITDSSSHFATMPTKLVEPCILAGSSAKGACSECGSPWERITEKDNPGHDGETESRYETGSTANRLAKLRQAARANGEEYVNRTITTGWAATCGCGADIVPCVVLDPFCGSGTTLAVALKHHRHGIGIELNESYISLAHDRIRKSQPMLLEVTC